MAGKQRLARLTVIGYRYLHCAKFVNEDIRRKCQGISCVFRQAANLGEFCASMNPRFEREILDFMEGIPDFIKKKNVDIF